MDGVLPIYQGCAPPPPGPASCLAKAKNDLSMKDTIL